MMIRYDAKNCIVVMDLVDLEHCGFDWDEFAAEIELAGIKDNAALNPIALLVNFSGGAVVLPTTPAEARAKMVADSKVFKDMVAKITDQVPVVVDRAAAMIYNCAEDHRDTWRDKPDRFWYLGLLEEVAELGLALLGWHKHPYPDDDTVDWELRQIGSIAMNWIRKRDSVVRR
jgi:hypothetical protein